MSYTRVLKTFACNQTPGWDGLPFKFYLTSGITKYNYLQTLSNYSNILGKVGITQCQGILTLIQKKTKN